MAANSEKERSPAAESSETFTYKENEMYIDITSVDWVKRAADAMDTYGILVLTNVITQDFCTTKKTEFGEVLTTISINAQSLAASEGKITSDKYTPFSSETFSPYNIPFGGKDGLMQSLIAPFLWDVRAHTRVREVNQKLYTELRHRRGSGRHENQQPIEHFYSSNDGAYFAPPKKPSRRQNKQQQQPDSAADWAHLDYTGKRNSDVTGPVMMQGQVVLSDTPYYAFRASPRSHKVYDEIDRECDKRYGKPRISNWRKFPREFYSFVQEKVESVGGKFQVPIFAPAGSLILWDTQVVHSSCSYSLDEIPLSEEDKMEMSSGRNPYKFWRFVVYVCYRPQIECGPGHETRLVKAFENNRVTTHSGTRLMGLTPAYSKETPDLPDNVVNYPFYVFFKDPSIIFNFLPRPPMTPEIEELIRWQLSGDAAAVKESKKRKRSVSSSNSSPSKKILKYLTSK